MKPKKLKSNPKNKREPGSEWRLSCFHVSSTGTKFRRITTSHPGPERARGAESVLTEFKFDEITVDDWLHIERMGEDTFWVRIGQQEFDVRVSLNKKVPSTATKRVSERSPKR